MIALNKEEELVAPTDNDVVELEKLTVKKGQVTEEIVDLGRKSSYAYAPEMVRDKEKMGWNKWKFWQKDRHSDEDKLRYGHDYVEKPTWKRKASRIKLIGVSLPGKQQFL